MSFGVTNRVACFQCKMDDLIAENELEDTFAYLDNVTICGMTQEEHYENLEKFREAAQKCNLTLNDENVYFHLDPSASLVTELVKENLVQIQNVSSHC